MKNDIGCDCNTSEKFGWWEKKPPRRSCVHL
jgi:hypothetical protein